MHQRKLLIQSFLSFLCLSFFILHFSPLPTPTPLSPLILGDCSSHFAFYIPYFDCGLKKYQVNSRGPNREHGGECAGMPICPARVQGLPSILHRQYQQVFSRSANSPPSALLTLLSCTFRRFHCALFKQPTNNEDPKGLRKTAKC